jgi:hypothetical protein
VQYLWASWSDGGAASHSITVPASATTYTANFITQYWLTTAVNPVVSPAAGTISPATGWFNSGSVSVTATANSGYQFSSFTATGATLTGSGTTQTLALTAPAMVTAYFNAVPTQTVAAPSFSPLPGSYSAAQTVTLTTSTPGASIRYTMDGVTTPTETVGTLYTGPISVASTTTIKAIAYESGWTDSSVASGTFTISTGGGGGSPPTAGLVGYWNFDEGSGGIAHDTSGGGHNGPVNGAAWTAGKINTGLTFNGSSNNVITPAIALGGAFSVSAWVNPSVIPQIGYVRIAETNYASGFYLGTDTTGTKYKLIVNGGAGVTGTCGYGCAEGGTITSGWHLVTATFDGATARLYVDNAVAGSDTFTAPSNTNLPLYIGISYVGSGYGWNGTIDEVRLYNRALSSAEVSAIYNYSGDTTPPSTPANVSATAVSPSQINVSGVFDRDLVERAITDEVKPLVFR